MILFGCCKASHEPKTAGGKLRGVNDVTWLRPVLCSAHVSRLAKYLETCFISVPHGLASGIRRDTQGKASICTGEGSARNRLLFA